MGFDRARYSELVCGLPERFLRTGARSHVYVKMRAVDARRFVREFKKEYGDRIEGARKVKTEGDALDALLGWMDGARPSQLSAKDGCWRFTGEDVAVWLKEIGLAE